MKSIAAFSRRILALVLALGALLAASAPSAYGDLTSHEKRIIQAIKGTQPSVVDIDSSQSASATSGRGLGSGVIYSSDGYIITNAHVVKQAGNILVTMANGKRYHATNIKASSNYDLAVIKINATGLPVPHWGDSNRLQVGQSAIVIGNPVYFNWSVSEGIISALGRDFKVQGIHYREMIQTDAPVNPGNSGGAMVNTDGEVIGIVSIIYRGADSQYGGSGYQGLAFAIPINQALEEVQRIISTRQSASAKPWVGLQAINVDRQMAEQYDFPVSNGILITFVMPASPAAAARLQRGDIITAFNGQAIRSTDEFKRLLARTSPGNKVTLAVWRAGKKMDVVITVDQMSQ